MRLLLPFIVLAGVIGLIANHANANPGSEGAKDPGWPSWRGPTHDGHATDQTVPLEWSRTKNLKWQVDMPGAGNSSPVVWGNRVFLTAATKDGTERWIVCIDRTSGKILWQRTVAKGLPTEPVHAWNTHASATCATDGERVYAFFGTPGLFCYDLDGKLLWSRDFGLLGSSTAWGAGAGSPVLFEDLVFVNGDQGALRGQTDEKGVDYGPSWLWALDKRSGKVVWKTLRNQGMGWCTPVIWSGAGRPELVLNGQLGVWSYDPRTGKELWHVHGRKDGEGFGEVTPIWGHDLLFTFTGKPGPAWAIRPGGKGDVSKTHVAWQIQRKDRDVSSPILVGDHIYTVSRIGVATCLEAKTGNEVWRERLGGQPCASLLCVRGKVMILNEEGTAFIIEPGPHFKLLHENRLGQREEFRASPAVVDGQLLIRSTQRLYCIANDDVPQEGGAIEPEIRTLGAHKGSVLTVAFAPNGKLLASAARDHVIKLWDVESGKLQRTLEGHDADIYCATFSRDGKLLATGSADKTVRLWNVDTGKVEKTLTGHTDVVRSVVFSNDGKTLASGGKDETIRLWDAATWKLTATLQAHSLRGLSFAPDGATLASGGTDKTVRLWDMPAGKARAILKGHISSIEAVAYSPQGRLLASSSADSTVRLWDPDRGTLVRILEGHSSEIDSIAFSPDGEILASGSKDKTLKLWDPETGKLLKTVTGAQNRLESLAFSPDGKLLASGSGGPEALVRIYDLRRK